MIIILLLIVVLFVLYESLRGTGTANLAPVTPPGVPQDLVTGTSDNGLSPIDIGGISLSIPTGVLQWKALAEKYANINSILDPEEILAIIWNESSGNPQAQNPNDPSWGLMGVTFNIGQAYAGISDPQELFDPEKNIKAGSGFLAHLKSRFGDNPNWSSAYNEGETKFAQGINVSLGYAQAFNSHLLTLQGLG